MKKSVGWGLAIIIAVTCFTCVFSYMNEPIGDDVLNYNTGALTFYLDEFESNLGDRYENLFQIASSLKFTYMHWSGRMTGYALCMLGKLFPKFIQALATALIFTMNILLAMKIAFKKWDKVLSSPLIFGLIYLALYFYRRDTYYTYMWTMVSVYSFGVMLCLLYYNLSVVDRREKKEHNRILLCVIGFFAGFSHEVISLCMICILGGAWLVDIFRHNEKRTALFRHTAFGIGYLLCFFAPGNFYRTMQSHDAVTSGFGTRLLAAWQTHKSMFIATKWSHIIFWIFLILAYTIVVALVSKKNKDALTEIIENIAPFLMGGFPCLFGD